VIYLSDDMENIPADVIREIFSLMPMERRQRALRYKQDIDSNLCVLAYWLLLHGLKEEYGIIKPPNFIYGENGKPYLAEYPGIFFNISHCKAGVVCAISDVEVGIDIQEVRPFDLDVAKRVCTDSELEQFALTQEPERLFCEMWTMKESYIKQQGGSIAQSLNMLDAHIVFEQASGKKICHWGHGFHICCIGEDKLLRLCNIR
jgi:4'-phosphopantetheinyl transferase